MLLEVDVMVFARLDQDQQMPGAGSQTIIDDAGSFSLPQSDEQKVQICRRRMRISLIGPVYPYRGGIAHHTALLA